MAKRNQNDLQVQLKKLKKQLAEAQQAEKIATERARQQTANDNLDEDYFREAMHGVQPLEQKKVHHEADKPAASVRFSSSTEDERSIEDTLSDELEVEMLDAESVMSYCDNGIQRNTFKKLRSGAYEVIDELDLHGATIKEAKQILLLFLQQAEQFEGCCIRIIHGKGNRSLKNQKALLKSYVNHWLGHHQRVLAFHSAKSRDGGNGAVYVLLKRL